MGWDAYAIQDNKTSDETMKISEIKEAFQKVAIRIKSKCKIKYELHDLTDGVLGLRSQGNALRLVTGHSMYTDFTSGQVQHLWERSITKSNFEYGSAIDAWETIRLDRNVRQQNSLTNYDIYSAKEFLRVCAIFCLSIKVSY